MGEQDSGGSSQDAMASRTSASIKQAAKERKRKQEEAMMSMAENEDQVGLYARSSSGNLVRSSSGNAVTSRAGRQAQENIRAAYGGRESRDMDAEFPMDTGGDDQPMQMSGQSKVEPKKTVKGPSAAARKLLLAQSQVAQKTRQFY